MTLVIPRHHEVANAEHSAGGYWIPGSRPFRTSPNDVTCDLNFEIDQPAFISGVDFLTEQLLKEVILRRSFNAPAIDIQGNFSALSLSFFCAPWKPFFS